jgi:uncharacterized membrane protein YgdD (TMEM256/DUF423 family)
LLFAIGCGLAAFAVGAGAFGAHALRAQLEPDRLAQFETAARYQMYHALAIIVSAFAGERLPSSIALYAGWLFVVGVLVFCGSVYGLSFGAPRWLGAVAPVGGLGFIAGWLLLGWSALKS